MPLPYTSNLVFHYDFAESSTITVVDGKVSAVADLANSYDLSQSFAGNRPTVATVDGVTCLQFGTGGSGTIHLIGSGLPLTGDATLIAKVRGNGFVQSNRNGMFFKADSVPQSHFGGVSNVSGQWYESFGGAGTGFLNRPLLNVDISNVSQGVWTTATIRRSDDTIYGGFDGTEGSGASSVAGGWTSVYRIGQLTSNWHWNGYIAYMALYDRSLSAEEIAAVVAALDSTGNLSTGLQGWWCPSLDTSGNGTTTLTDLSGNGNNGTLTNMDAATDWIADTDSGGVRALDFDGINDFVNFGNVLDLGVGEPISVEAWIYCGPTLPAANVSFVSKQNKNGPFNGYNLFYHSSAAEFRFQVAEAVTNSYLQFGFGSWGSGWCHLAATYDGSEDVGGISCYINGVLQSAGSTANSLSGSPSTTTPLQIGGRDSSIWFFPGLIDAVAIWDRSLTADEVTQLYNGGRSLNLLGTTTTQSIVPQLLLRRHRMSGGLLI